MVFSYYIYKYPYRLIWRIRRLFRKGFDLAFYCADPIDWIILSRLREYLPPLRIIASGNATKAYLRERGIAFQSMPAFPDAVIMSRHAAHKFPEKRIMKFGLRHGVYHFKRFTSARNYNLFDLYFVTSSREEEIARSLGIRSARAAGFPKLDPAFDGTYPEDRLDVYRRNCGLDRQKKTVLFTATWEKSGMSAVQLWKDRIGDLTNRYNVLVTLHPWISGKVRQSIAELPGIYFIADYDVLPYMLIADVMVGDTSSIIGEFCVLDKPIITFRVPDARRMLPEIRELLESISMRVATFDEMETALRRITEAGDDRKEQRVRANRIMFDKLDGLAGKRITGEIVAYLEKSGKSAEESI